MRASACIWKEKAIACTLNLTAVLKVKRAKVICQVTQASDAERKVMQPILYKSLGSSGGYKRKMNAEYRMMNSNLVTSDR